MGRFATISQTGIDQRISCRISKPTYMKRREIFLFLARQVHIDIEHCEARAGLISPQAPYARCMHAIYMRISADPRGPRPRRRIQLKGYVLSRWVINGQAWNQWGQYSGESAGKKAIVKRERSRAPGRCEAIRAVIGQTTN